MEREARNRTWRIYINQSDDRVLIKLHPVSWYFCTIRYRLELELLLYKLWCVLFLSSSVYLFLSFFMNITIVRLKIFKHIIEFIIKKDSKFTQIRFSTLFNLIVLIVRGCTNNQEDSSFQFLIFKMFLKICFYYYITS